MDHAQFQSTVLARNAFWSKVGQLDSDVCAPLVNPAFLGGPKWPSLRQTFGKVTLPDNSTIIFSDGLSDPFEDQKSGVNGYELEFFLHTNSLTTPLTNSWEFEMFNQMSQNAVAMKNIRDQIDKYQYLTTELYVDHLPAEFRNSAGRVGVILGIPSPVVPETIKLPLSETRAISLVLLTLKELEYCVQNGPKGRQELAQKLIHTTGTLNSIARPSLF